MCKYTTTGKSWVFARDNDTLETVAQRLHTHSNYAHVTVDHLLENNVTRVPDLAKSSRLRKNTCLLFAQPERLMYEGIVLSPLSPHKPLLVPSIFDELTELTELTKDNGVSFFGFHG